MTGDEMVGWHHLLNGYVFSKLREMVMDREALHARVHGVAKGWTWLRDWATTKRQLLIPPASVKKSKQKEHGQWNSSKQSNILSLIYSSPNQEVPISSMSFQNMPLCWLKSSQTSLFLSILNILIIIVDVFKAIKLHASKILCHNATMQLTFSSLVATAEFSKFAGILRAALSQHHLSGIEIAQLEFHHLH